MSNQLYANLMAINEEKQAKIIPENIKSGVTIFGVEGNLESGTSNVPVKLFETVEEMQSDSTAKEKDLALVYREEIQNANADSVFSQAKFPSTVVLPQAVTDYIDVRYGAVDESVMFDCWGSLDSSRFDMSCYTDNGSISIRYESSDGITYTRTEGEETIDFGTEIHYTGYEEFNELIGYFIQAGGMTFDGLYKYGPHTDTENIWFSNIDNLTFDFNGSAISNVTWNNRYDSSISYENLSIIINNLLKYNSNAYLMYFGYDEQGQLRAWCGARDSGTYLTLSTYGCNGLGYNTNKDLIGVVATNTYDDLKLLIFTIDEDTLDYTDVQLLEPAGTIGSLRYYDFKPTTIPFNFSSSGNLSMYDGRIYVSNNGSAIQSNYGNGYVINDGDFYRTYMQYIIAPTQLNLSGSNQLLPGKIGYGKNGVVTGDESVYNEIILGEVIKAQSTDPYVTYELCEYGVQGSPTGGSDKVDGNYVVNLSKPEGLFIRRKYIKNINGLINGLTYLKLYPIRNYFMLVGYNGNTNVLKILDNTFELVQEILLPENTSSENSNFYMDFLENNNVIKCACYSRNGASTNGVLVFITIENGNISYNMFEITDTNVLSNVRRLYMVDEQVILTGSYVFKTPFNGESLTQLAYGGTNLYSVPGINVDDLYVYIHSDYRNTLYIYNRNDFSEYNTIDKVYGLFSNTDKIYACLNDDSPTEIYEINGTTTTKIADWTMYTGNLNNGSTYWYYDAENNFIHSIETSSVNVWLGEQQIGYYANLNYQQRFDYRMFNPMGDNIGYAITNAGDIMKYVIN